MGVQLVEQNLKGPLTIHRCSYILLYINIQSVQYLLPIYLHKQHPIPTFFSNFSQFD